jgi:hypothetical protein
MGMERWVIRVIWGNFWNIINSAWVPPIKEDSVIQNGAIKQTEQHFKNKQRSEARVVQRIH